MAIINALAQTVFVSHSGSDSARAAAVADLLTGSGIEVRLDRKELRLGESFLSFMNSALTDSDYCLLLWSKNAAQTQWVQMEWESALYRSVEEKRAFLVTGRLEEAALPPLLAPRLRVDLFPELQPGIDQIIETWRADRSAESETQRPVAGSPIGQPEGGETSTVYVTSDAFGITVPVPVDLNAPAGLLLDRVVARAALPRRWEYGGGKIGVQFTYTLMNGNKELDRSTALVAQNVSDRAVLWIRTVMSQFSEVAPVEVHGKDTIFRVKSGDSESLMAGARAAYFAAIRQARLEL